MRSTILSVAFSVAIIAGVPGFSGSLGKLFDDPRLYGWNWDVQIGDAFPPTSPGRHTAMAHTLTTSVRRRRRELAILKVLGFVRSQVAATVAWQSSMVVILAVVLGLPIGLAAGRWAWHVFADRLGVPPQAAVPLFAAALLVPATLLLANLVALVPARLASRTRASVVLGNE